MRKGLTVTLDARTDQIEAASVHDDFRGFMAVVNSRESYPITSQRQIRVRPGHDTLVSLDAVDVRADKEGIQDIPVDKRQCLFPDEGDFLQYHRNYSQASCLLECQMDYVTQRMSEPCIPWYLPRLDGRMPMCDPWQAVEYKDILDEMTEECEEC